MSGSNEPLDSARQLTSSLRLRASLDAARLQQAREQGLQGQAQLLLNLGSVITSSPLLQDNEFVVSEAVYSRMKGLIAAAEYAAARQTPCELQVPQFSPAKAMSSAGESDMMRILDQVDFS